MRFESIRAGIQQSGKPRAVGNPQRSQGLEDQPASQALHDHVPDASGEASCVTYVLRPLWRLEVPPPWGPGRKPCAC